MEIKTNKLKTLWNHTRSWMKAHPRKSLLIAGAFLIGAAATATYWIVFNNPVSTERHVILSGPKEQPKPKPVFYSPLTGVKVKNEAATKQAVTAIMLENSPSARPQSGMKEAGVVFEAIAEGGITRFLALYQESKPELVGPVRSLRMYYVDWLAPFNASVVHIGGSAAALAEVRSGSYRDIDQFFNSQYYWRATDRYAPHNVYTSFAKLDALNKAKGYTKSTFKSWPRKDGSPSLKQTAKNITINFSSYLYNTTYTYSEKSNKYKRSLGGEPHLDREKGLIAPSVVIAMYVDEVNVLEDGYRESITTTGSGEAVIFQNGAAKTATWKKKDRGSQLLFIDKDDKEIPLVRGQTWIAAVPNHQGSVSWQ